jgi:hypothetical protein
MNARDELQTSGNNSLQTTPLLFPHGTHGRAVSPSGLQGMTIFEGLVFEGLERQMTSYQLEHEAAISEIRKRFVLTPDAAIISFLNEHRTIPQIVLGAAPHLSESFGPRTIFNLRAPLDESGFRTLYAVAMWPGRVEDVREALARFDDAWWIAHSRLAAGHLAFTYELV